MSKNTKNAAKNKLSFKEFLQQRSTRKGSISILITVLFIVAVILLNLVLGAIKDRHPMYIDVTENSLYQLQQSTKDSLDEVDRPVSLYVLQKEADFENGNANNYKYFAQANKLLHAMEEYSDNIDLHYIDLDTQPTFTGAYPDVDWTLNHAILVVSGDRYRAVDFTDLFDMQYADSDYSTIVITRQKVEQAIMTAIVNVLITTKTTVSVLTSEAEQDMTAFKDLLEKNAFDVEEVSLLNDSIPEDSKIAVIYDPGTDINDKTAEKLKSWLYNDGKFGHHLIYFPNDQLNVNSFPNLNDLIADYGMQVEYGYIFENNQDYLIPDTDHYHSLFTYGDDQTYTETLGNVSSLYVAMCLTMPVTITDESMAKPLLQSSDQSFLFPKGLSDEELNDYVPELHKLNGAAIGVHNDGSLDGKDSSVVVFGSYDAVTSNYLSYSSYNNAAYIINLFNILSENDELNIVVEGKEPTAKNLGVTPSKPISGPATLVFLLPAAVLLTGLIIWLRRRHR